MKIKTFMKTISVGYLIFSALTFSLLFTSAAWPAVSELQPVRTIILVKPVRNLDPWIGDYAEMFSGGLKSTHMFDDVAVDKRQWRSHREYFLPLAEDKQLGDALERFYVDLSDRIAAKFGNNETQTITARSEVERRILEKQEAGKGPVLSVEVLNLYRIQGCSELALILGYGMGQMKASTNARGKPIVRYIERDRHYSAISSRFCPREYKAEPKYGWRTHLLVKIPSAEFIRDSFQRSAAEILSSVGPWLLTRVENRQKTHTLFFPVTLVEYRRGRTMAYENGVYIWVDDSKLKERLCRSACRPLLEAQAAERERKRAWKAEQEAPSTQQELKTSEVDGDSFP